MQKVILTMLFVAAPIWAGLDAATVWELRQSATASNVNGGGFNPANANMAADLTTDTNTGNTSSPVVSSASYNFAAGDVNAWVYVKSGSNWTAGQWCQIASVASNKATLTAGVGTCILVSNGRYTTNTSAGVASVGTPTNGTWAIDYTQQNAAVLNPTDLASVGGSSTATSVAGGFTKAMIGNLIHVTTTGTGAHCVVGWYEVSNQTDTNTITLDRTPNDGVAGAACTAYIGGAMSMNSTLDDDLAESIVAGNHIFVKNGSSFSLGEAVSISANGSAASQINVEGYNSSRGDTPTGSNRPTFNVAANGWTNATSGSGTDWNYSNIIWTGTANPVLGVGTRGRVFNCKATNTSTTAARSAITFGGQAFLYNSEAVAYRGRAVNFASTSSLVAAQGNYLHDSDIGVIAATTTGSISLIRNIISGHVTNAVQLTGTFTGDATVVNNTLYGSANTTGTGIQLAASSTGPIRLYNNIIAGFATGVNNATSGQTHHLDDYNAYFNNDTDVTNWNKGAHDIATSPSFSNVAQLTGSTATTSGSVLTQSGGNFSTVTDNVDFLYLVSGTGITAGQYLITSHTSTTVTLDIAPGTNATADKVWQITTGHNFGVGANMRAVGFPGAFQAGLTTGYLDLGAVQSQGSSSTGVSYVFIH